MNSEEGKLLMTGSWVLVNGVPRQVASLKGDKVGFEKHGKKKLEFYSYEQIAGIPLSALLLAWVVKYRYDCPRRVYNVTCFGNNIIYIFGPRSFSIYRFNYLHELQVCLLFKYRVSVVLDSSGYSSVESLKEKAINPLTSEEEQIIGDYIASNPSRIGGVNLSKEDVEKIISSRKKFFKKTAERVILEVEREKQKNEQQKEI